MYVLFALLCSVHCFNALPYSDPFVQMLMDCRDAHASGDDLDYSVLDDDDVESDSGDEDEPVEPTEQPAIEEPNQNQSSTQDEDKEMTPDEIDELLYGEKL
jgi:hypothetical protein